MAAPPVRRLKTYNAQTGYVYEYYFVGKRAALSQPPQAPATEYVFDVTPDRKVTYAVSVFLHQAALHSWAAAHGRSLSDAEQYAAAKLRLLQGLDEIENVLEHGRRLAVDSVNIDDVLAPLSLE